MEAIIIGLIAGLGYAVSQQGITTRKKADVVTVDRPESYPFPSATTSKELRKEQEKASEARWLASQDPRGSGIVDPRTLPYFTSARTQNTNDDLKQRRMEGHTGAAPTWQHKKESVPFFEPVSQNVLSSGSSGNGPTYETMRKASAVSGVQNNVLPFEQVQVGRGIGLDPKTPAGDGFHSTYRVMPIDHASYKKNTVEARPNHGAAINSAREVDPKYYSKGVPRFYTMERRPMEKGRAAVTAQTQRPAILTPGCHVDTEEYFGIAGAVGHHVGAGNQARNKHDNRPGLPLTNVTGERHGLGGYTVADFDNARVISQQREQGTGGAAGVPAHFVPAGTTQPSDLPQPTLREQLHDQSNGFAAAAPVVRGARVQCTNKQLLKESKRGSQVVNTYVAAPQRTSEFRRAKMGDDLLAETRCVPMAVKADGHVHRQMSHAQASVMYMNQASAGTSSIANRNRLPEENRFQDFTIARDNVKNNDLHIRIN
jgi:hypothetical protein